MRKKKKVSLEQSHSERESTQKYKALQETWCQEVKPLKELKKSKLYRIKKALRLLKE